LSLWDGSSEGCLGIEESVVSGGVGVEVRKDGPWVAPAPQRPRTGDHVKAAIGKHVMSWFDADSPTGDHREKKRITEAVVSISCRGQIPRRFKGRREKRVSGGPDRGFVNGPIESGIIPLIWFWSRYFRHWEKACPFCHCDGHEPASRRLRK